MILRKIKFKMVYLVLLDQEFKSLRIVENGCGFQMEKKYVLVNKHDLFRKGLYQQAL